MQSDLTKNYFPIYFAKSGIHIKPENRGKFTETKKRTGKTTEELTHSKNPLTRKRAIFALNAKKWKHQDGGVIYFAQDGMKTKDPTNPPTTDRFTEYYEVPSGRFMYGYGSNGKRLNLPVGYLVKLEELLALLPATEELMEQLRSQTKDLNDGHIMRQSGLNWYTITGDKGTRYIAMKPGTSPTMRVKDPNYKPIWLELFNNWKSTLAANGYDENGNDIQGFDLKLYYGYKNGGKVYFAKKGIKTPDDPPTFLDKVDKWSDIADNILTGSQLVTTWFPPARVVNGIASGLVDGYQIVRALSQGDKEALNQNTVEFVLDIIGAKGLKGLKHAAYARRGINNRKVVSSFPTLDKIFYIVDHEMPAVLNNIMHFTPLLKLNGIQEAEVQQPVLQPKSLQDRWNEWDSKLSDEERNQWGDYWLTIINNVYNKHRTRIDLPDRMGSTWNYNMNAINQELDSLRSEFLDTYDRRSQFIQNKIADKYLYERRNLSDDEMFTIYDAFRDSSVYGFSPDVIMQVIGSESNFNSAAANPSSTAKGLFQLTDVTLQRLYPETWKQIKSEYENNTRSLQDQIADGQKYIKLVYKNISDKSDTTFGRLKINFLAPNANINSKISDKTWNSLSDTDKKALNKNITYKQLEDYYNTNVYHVTNKVSYKFGGKIKYFK